MPFQRVEAALEDTVADSLRQLGLAALGAVELRAPFGEAARSVRDRRELKCSHVVVDTHRTLNDFVAAAEVVVRQRQQAFADHAAVTGVEVPDAADAVARLVVLDAAIGYRWVPLRQRIEVTDTRPDRVGAGVDNAAHVDLNHRLLLWRAQRQTGVGAADAAHQVLYVAAFDTNFA